MASPYRCADSCRDVILLSKPVSVRDGETIHLVGISRIDGNLRYAIFMGEEKTQFGTVPPSDVSLTFPLGAIGTIVGFLVSLLDLHHLWGEPET